MRKPRDYDAELQALADKARQLKARKAGQLGELVTATGADALPPEELAGALLDAAGTSDSARKEAWHKRGAAFFSVGPATSARTSSRSEPRRAAPEQGRIPPPRGEPGAG